MSTPTQEAKVVIVNKTKTLVALVLDETGSMQHAADDTIGSVNSYFETLAKETPEAVVSIMQFSDCFGAEPNFRPFVTDVPVTEVPKLDPANYRPRGNTPLYDAIGKAIRDTEKVEADRYLLVVMTDGLENASREWTLSTVKTLIGQKQALDNWTIVYLGANQDAWIVGGSMGISPGNTMSFQTGATGKGMRASGQSLGAATSAYVTGATGAEGPNGPTGAFGKTETFFEDAKQDASDYEDPDEKVRK